MSLVLNPSSAAQYMKRGPPALQSQHLCLNRQWVESNTNLWPLWTESHLIFLIRKFNLSSISQDEIAHTSIDSIIEATQMYLDTTEWTTVHTDRLWEKANLKIGYLHANMTGFKNQSLVNHYCKQRLLVHQRYQMNLKNHSTNQDSNTTLASSHLAPMVVTQYFVSAPNLGKPTSQNTRTDHGNALQLWKSMSSEIQANLFRSQLRTAKGFGTLVALMKECCKEMRARIHTANQYSAGTPTPASAKPTENALRLQTNLPSSTASYRKFIESAVSERGSGSAKAIFDGLPTAIKTPEKGWSATPFSVNYPCADDTNHSRDDDGVQEIDKHEFEKEKEKKLPPPVSKTLDFKAIIESRLQELELKRKAGRNSAEDYRVGSGVEAHRLKRRQVTI